MKWLKIGSFEGYLRAFSTSEIDWIYDRWEANFSGYSLTAFTGFVLI